MDRDDEVRDYGLRKVAPKPDHWFMGQGKARARLGAAAAADLKPDGDWSRFDPLKEAQKKNGFETMNCTNFATIIAYIVLSNFHRYDDFPKECSERYTGVMTGTSPTGNDPHHVAEIIRNFSGLIPEERLPWTTQDAWNEYYAPDPMDETLVAEGQDLLEKFVLVNEWVFPPGNTLLPSQKADRLKAALKRGTVCVSVRAWKKKDGVYVKDIGEDDTHWVWLKQIDERDRPRIRDQYSPYDKILAKDYDFDMAKVYFLGRNETGISPVQRDYIALVFKWASDVLKKLFPSAPPGVPDVKPEPVPLPEPVKPTPMPEPVPTNREKLYAKAKSLIGTKQVSPGVPESLGCASALNNVFRQCFGKAIGGGASTAEMFKVLKTDPRFEEVSSPLPGDIVMNASGTSTKGYANGHVGIRGFTETMSNNSANGLWSAHYTNAAWESFFAKTRGFKSRYFRVRG